ncbi:MAG: formylglycine-generating enzyme family protein [Thermoguttaceae bacterium]|nr:formylglycine-generating enzyme family protein [Thermoguttaceae bacterium]
MKSQKKLKTTKHLATLSAALFVGSLATFGADVRVWAVSQNVDAKSDVATPSAVSSDETSKTEKYRRYSTSLSNPADFDLADEHPSWSDVSEAGKRKTLVILGCYWPFRYCPPGTFAMGAAPNEPGRFGLALKTEPRRCVTLTRGFWTLEFEVTQRMWKVVMEEKNPSFFSREGEKAASVANLDTLDFPVENVSWNDGQEFVRKLNERRLAPPGFEFRLPTDAQWEYACRAGTTTPYPYGERPTKKQINYCDDMSLGADARLRPLRVASLEPNPWGLYDMCGNVSEWCLDGDVKTQTGGGTGDDESPLIDPVGATVGGDRRVTRGGAYHNEISLCRSASRSSQELDRGASWQGFRLVLVPVDDPEAADEVKSEETADAELATACPTTFHIVDADGAPVPRAEVRLMKTEGEERVAVLTASAILTARFQCAFGGKKSISKARRSDGTRRS